MILRQRFGPEINASPLYRHLFSQQAFPGATHAGPQAGSGRETWWVGSTEAGKTDSRLAAGGLVEATAEDEVAQLVLLQRRKGVWQSRQNVDVVEAIPLPHRIHP